MKRFQIIDYCIQRLLSTVEFNHSTISYFFISNHSTFGCIGLFDAFGPASKASVLRSRPEVFHFRSVIESHIRLLMMRVYFASLRLSVVWLVFHML